MESYRNKWKNGAIHLNFKAQVLELDHYRPKPKTMKIIDLNGEQLKLLQVCFKSDTLESQLGRMTVIVFDLPQKQITN